MILNLIVWVIFVLQEVLNNEIIEFNCEFEMSFKLSINVLKKKNHSNKHNLVAKIE